MKPFYVTHKETGILYVVDFVRRSVNGRVDLIARPVGGGKAERVGWWMWWGDACHSVEDFLRRLPDVPGWSPSIDMAIREHHATCATADGGGQSREATEPVRKTYRGPTLTGRNGGGTEAV